MGIYKPEVGDKVWFWDDMGQLWDTGEVIAYGADRRLYFIQPNDEDMLECLVNYTNIRPVSEQKTTGRMSALEFELDYWKNRAEVTHLQHVAANKRADDAEARIEELEDQNRILKADRDQLKIERDDAWQAKGRAETGELFAKADLDELRRYVDSQKTSPVPKAVIDGQGDEWTLNRDTGYYEISDLYENLEYIERRWGIEERIY